MIELRKALTIIFDFIQENEKVLDVGCGNGELLNALLRMKKVDCRGIELSQDGVNNCVEKGLSVIQGDANFDLSDYPNSIFNTVILSQTIHAMLSPKDVIKDLIRIGKKAIISFPNFGYWSCRAQIIFNGQMPVTKDLKLPWYDTQNIHLCTIKDFNNLIREMNLKIDRKFGINNQKLLSFPYNLISLNLFASHAVFLVSKNTK